MGKFCTFICFKQGNFEDDLFQDAIVHDTNNISQYRLALKIDSLGRNRLCSTQEIWHQNWELSA